MNRQFTEEDIQMANKPTKDTPHHQPLEKCKLKPQGDTAYLSEWLKQKIVTPNAGEDVEKLDPSYIVDRKDTWQLLVKLNM